MKVHEFSWKRIDEIAAEYARKHNVTLAEALLIAVELEREERIFLLRVDAEETA